MSSETIATRFGSGQAVRRVEDDTLLTGKGKYADDFMPPGQLFMQFLRSPYPHARITAIDTTAARLPPADSPPTAMRAGSPPNSRACSIVHR